MRPIIRVENLSKQYRIGARQTPYLTLRESIINAARSPLNWFRRNGHSEENTIWALKDVGFEVMPGEVVGIIGRNGAGKSTLLKILSRITEPTTGQVDLYGRVGSLLEVGTGFHTDLSGRENIYLNGAILGMRRNEIDRKFDEIVAFAEIEKFIDTPVKHYSSGMYMRLAFAVAAHLEPEILLVDEVLAVGDAAFQRKCLGKMENVARDGRTVFFVSHNLPSVRSLCSRGILMDYGRVNWAGGIQECIDRYLNSASNELPSEIDTSALPRPSTGVDDEGALRILRVALDMPTGQAVLKTGEPITLILRLQTFRPLTKVVYGLAIQSSDKIRLFECRSSDSFRQTLSLQPGIHTIQVVINSNPLNPGLYSLSVGARCESKALDYLPDVILMRVDSTERFDSVWLEAPSGLFRVQSDWAVS